MKTDVIQHDVSHMSADIFHGCDSFDFALCESKKLFRYREPVDKGHC